MSNPHQQPLTPNEEKLCQPCEQPVEDKIIPCPLQCMSPKCKAYKNRPPLIDTSKTPIIWILGGPGSGKGTQCELIIAKYGFVHLSSGDLLRAEVKSGSSRAQFLNGIMTKGELVPNEIVLDLLKEAMLAHIKKGQTKGFLIDGYPREKRQGLDFERTIAPINAILYFHASEQTLLKRLEGRQAGRADDKPEIFKERLKIFFANNDGVLATHPKKVHRINAERPPDEIFQDVQTVIDHVVQIKWPLDP